MGGPHPDALVRVTLANRSWEKLRWPKFSAVYLLFPAADSEGGLMRRYVSRLISHSRSENM